MKKYVKPDTEIINIETLRLLEINYDDGQSGITGADQTKGEGAWIDEEEDSGWW